MKNFIEVSLSNDLNNKVTIALSSISMVDMFTVKNARIVTNYKLQFDNKPEVIITSQDYHQVLLLMKEASK